jgi:hypothetical protein
MHEILDHGDGTYTLTVNGAEVVRIGWHYGVRACWWKVHGPADLEMSLELMKGFAHLAVLLGAEKQVFKAPVPEAPELLKMERKHGSIKESTRSGGVSKTSVSESSGQGTQGRSRSRQSNRRNTRR